MRRTRAELGRLGEDKAAEHLIGLGWQILSRNWRCREGEADIVALDTDAGALVVVEVKSRSGTGFGDPLDAITYEKARRLRHLAAIYAKHTHASAPLLRVDAIGIVWPHGQQPRLTHARGIEER